ncbi:MAG: carboxylesterase family protein [Pseudomonadota bacterium]
MPHTEKPDAAAAPHRRLRSAALGLLLMSALGLAQAQMRPSVSFKMGTVVGQDTAEGIRAFLGIPYAAQPVADLRWRAPQAHAPWAAPRDATSFGAACPQPDDRFAGLTPKVQDEACLYLNVWAPKAAQGLPVMVWLHGGAHRFGAGSIPFYDGSALAKRGVVVVTINYRLGYLGYFSHPALDAENEGGNFGLMDQKFALEWLREHIAAFGGDPKQITLFGESAGGADVLYLMADAKSQGLFQRAIVQSGGGWNRPLPKKKMQKDVLDSLEKAGVAASATAADLRQLDARKLVDALGGGIGFGAFLDEKVTFEPPSKAFEEGRAAKVPLIIGSNDWEQNLIFKAPPPKGLAARAIPHLPQVRGWYGGQAKTADARRRLLFRDVVFAAPARWLAAKHSQHAPAWLYSFTYVTSGSRGKLPGAGHAAEIAYVFDTLGATEKSAANASGEDRKLAAGLADCWAAFAKTGAPDCSLAKWQPFDANADNALLIDPNPRQIKLPDREVLDGVVDLFGPGTLLGS